MSPTEARQTQQDALRIALSQRRTITCRDYRFLPYLPRPAPPVMEQIFDELLQVDRCQVPTRGRTI